MLIIPQDALSSSMAQTSMLALARPIECQLDVIINANNSYIITAPSPVSDHVDVWFLC